MLHTRQCGLNHKQSVNHLEDTQHSKINESVTFSRTITPFVFFLAQRAHKTDHATRKSFHASVLPSMQESVSQNATGDPSDRSP